MQLVVGVRFKRAGKIYFFSPNNINFETGDGVIVETARGVEFGEVVFSNKEVTDDEVFQPLKPVLRKATEEDYVQVAKNRSDKQKAIDVAKEKILKHKLNMKLVDAEYTFDRNKIIFYFTAASRIDFRELVKDLASVFKNRIELRQIYERDDTKMRGALGPCGRVCCCNSYLPEFEKVSVKMAKLQGLSLNPTKISGVCGRLMCCLKYENEYYEDSYKKMPEVGMKAFTPVGNGNIENVNILTQKVEVRVLLADGSYDNITFDVDEIKFKPKRKKEIQLDEKEIDKEILELEKEPVDETATNKPKPKQYQNKKPNYKKRNNKNNGQNVQNNQKNNGQNVQNNQNKNNGQNVQNSQNKNAKQNENGNNNLENKTNQNKKPKNKNYKKYRKNKNKNFDKQNNNNNN